MTRLVPLPRLRDNHPLHMLSPVRQIIDFALPPRCGEGGAIVDSDHRFCVRCWTSLDFLTRAGCVLCNVHLKAVASSVCGLCLESPPRLDGVRAAVADRAVARDVALCLTQGRRNGLVRTRASIIAQQVDPTGNVVPVPLHCWRLWSRGFNQTTLVGHTVAAASGLELKTDALVRRRTTPPLRGLSAQRRADAVRSVFRTTTWVVDTTVWLVDDVCTSGASPNACAAALKRSGAQRVVALALVRVLARIDKPSPHAHLLGSAKERHAARRNLLNGLLPLLQPRQGAARQQECRL